MRTAEKLCVFDSVIRLGVPQPTEWQRIGNQINAAMIFARADFVNVHQITVKQFWVTRFRPSADPCEARVLPFPFVCFSKHTSFLNKLANNWFVFLVRVRWRSPTFPPLPRTSNAPAAVILLILLQPLPFHFFFRHSVLPPPFSQIHR